MTDSIPDLITKAREFDTAPAEYAVRLKGAHDLIARLADALESLSAPPASDAEREALIANLRLDAGDYGRHQADPGDRPRDIRSWDQREVRAWQAAEALEFLSAPAATNDDLDSLVDVMLNAEDMDATTTSIAKEVLAAGFRRLSPLTREALAEIIWDTSRADEGTISATGANIIADAILSRLSVPEPAEVEWEYGHRRPDLENAEPSLIASSSGATHRRVKAGPWGPVPAPSEEDPHA